LFSKVIVSMHWRTEELLKRTFVFGVGTLKFLRKLPEDSIYKIAKYQVARSATSVGANYEEAQGAISKRDFTNKISISYKESRESLYWLKVLRELYEESKYRDDFTKFINEAEELKKIFSSIKKSSRE
jgi:four helix bundle protein